MLPGTAAGRTGDATKYAGSDVQPTLVRRESTMARASPERLGPANLRKETRDWLATKTIPNAREIARDLENSGEDVRDLLAAIDELEAILQEGPRRRDPNRPSGPKA